jgi:hypothetical protein
VPGAVALTTIVAVADCPLASPPTKQISVSDPAHVPWLALSETSVMLCGRVSMTVTPVAAAGPLFRTVRLKVTWPLALTELGDAVLVSARSAAGPPVEQSDVGARATTPATAGRAVAVSVCVSVARSLIAPPAPQPSALLTFRV